MTSDDQLLSIGEDGIARCPWAAGGPGLVRQYHDDVWGHPEHRDDSIFEWMSLCGFAAGIRWITILRKRDAFRAAFSQFRIADVAAYDEAEIDALMSNASIIRNRAKLTAVVSNARVAVSGKESLSAVVWRFQSTHARNHGTAASTLLFEAQANALASELKRHGYKFVGPASVQALMQTIGLVNDHAPGCFRSLEPDSSARVRCVDRSA